MSCRVNDWAFYPTDCRLQSDFFLILFALTNETNIFMCPLTRLDENFSQFNSKITHLAVKIKEVR